MKTKRNQAKMSGLVVAALRNLRDNHGSSPKEIMKYIMAEYNASEQRVQRELNTALKRGVEYGILKKVGHGYSLNTEAQVVGPNAILSPEDACKKKKKKKKMSCKPKRKSCSRPKRKACPMKRKKKKDKCNVCASTGNGCDPSAEIHAVDDGAPELPRSRSQSRARSARSQSARRSQYSVASDPAEDFDNDSNA